MASCAGSSAGAPGTAHPLPTNERPPPAPIQTSPSPRLPAADQGKPPERVPELREALEPRPLTPFPSEEAACAAMYKRERDSSAGNVGVACAPFKTQRSCRLVRDPQSSVTLLEVGVVDTVPTEHCANSPGAPRANAKSVILTPATSSKGLRVGIESLVYAPYVSTMSAGLHDGAVKLEATATLGEREDADQVVVFRVQSARCVLVFTVCDHDYTWCTVPQEVWPLRRDWRDPGCEEASDVPKLQFARDDSGLRVIVGDAADGTLLYPFARQ